MDNRSNNQTTGQKSSIKKFPDLIKQVKLEDLTEEGNLFTQQDATVLIDKIEKKKTTLSQETTDNSSLRVYKFSYPIKYKFAYRFTKYELNSSYGIIAFDNNYYVVYHGVKKGLHIGMGGFGYAKHAQNIRTNEWVVLKVGGKTDYNSIEFSSLYKMGAGLDYLERATIKTNGFQHVEYSIKKKSIMPGIHFNMVMKKAPGVSLESIVDSRHPCDLIVVSLVPRKETLNSLSIKSDVAYVRCDDRLYYVDRTKNDRTKNKCVLVKTGNLEKFDEALHPSATCKVLSKEELQTITLMTDHVHRIQYDISDDKWIEILIQVTNAYKRVEENKIIHGDLNLSNIFYDFESESMIIDFGNAKNKKGFFKSKDKLVYTVGYLAPEVGKSVVKKNDEYKVTYTTEIDRYALGATFYHLLNFDLRNNTKLDLFSNKQLALKVRDLVLRLVNDNPKERPSPDVVLAELLVLKQESLLLLPEPFKKIGLLSIEEFLNLSKASVSSVGNDNSKNSKEEIPSQNQTENSTTKKEETEPKENLFKYYIKQLGSYVVSSFEPEFANIETPISVNTEPAIVQKSFAFPENLPSENSPKEKLTALLSALKLCDVVWIIDTKNLSRKELIKLGRELSDKGIRVGNIFNTSQQASLDVLKDFLEQAKKLSHAPLNKFIYLSTEQIEKEIHQLDAVSLMGMTIKSINDLDKYKIIINQFANAELIKEFVGIKQRLTNMMNDDNNKVIQATIDELDELYNNNKLSDNHLSECLKSLDQKLAEKKPQKDDLPIKKKSIFAFFQDKKEEVFKSKEISSIQNQHNTWKWNMLG